MPGEDKILIWFLPVQTWKGEGGWRGQGDCSNEDGGNTPQNTRHYNYSSNKRENLPLDWSRKWRGVADHVICMLVTWSPVCQDWSVMREDRPYQHTQYQHSSQPSPAIYVFYAQETVSLLTQVLYGCCFPLHWSNVRIINYTVPLQSRGQLKTFWWPSFIHDGIRKINNFDVRH